MSKIYTSLGTMSGTSLDGIDFSIIKTDGEDNISLGGNYYLEFSNNLKEKIKNIKSKIQTTNDCKKIVKSEEYRKLSNEVTMIHVDGIKEFILYKNRLPEIIGFHGITLWHKPADKYTHQIGDPIQLKKSLLNYFNVENTEIIFNFRENDIINGGQGAPLTPLYHQAILKHLKIVDPRLIVNIGGITNATYTNRGEVFSTDIGPGNCLINEWMKNNFDKDFDEDGKISLKGKVNKKIADIFLNNLKKLQKNKNNSFDTSNFNLSEFNSLEPKNGAATLSFVTAKAILNFAKNLELRKIILCGGGRYNQAILNFLKEGKFIISSIDDLNLFGDKVDGKELLVAGQGDFIESQAFAYLAVRSKLKKNISLSTTTGVKKSSTGGNII